MNHAGTPRRRCLHHRAQLLARRGQDVAPAGLARDHDRGGPTLSMDWEYLLMTGRRAG
ncbi:hypothetical protein AB0C87_10155 [Actinomadura sp. NPDC048021]|uniref:hypothetical protein n=1 Tax=Actinomadura sp. NPDC048021 TaxID=3155385 RepID=UPI0033DAB6A3